MHGWLGTPYILSRSLAYSMGVAFMWTQFDSQIVLINYYQAARWLSRRRHLMRRLNLSTTAQIFWLNLSLETLPYFSYRPHCLHKIYSFIIWVKAVFSPSICISFCFKIKSIPNLFFTLNKQYFVTSNKTQMKRWSLRQWKKNRENRTAQKT